MNQNFLKNFTKWAQNMKQKENLKNSRKRTEKIIIKREKIDKKVKKIVKWKNFMEIKI